MRAGSLAPGRAWHALNECATAAQARAAAQAQANTSTTSGGGGGSSGRSAFTTASGSGLSSSASSRESRVEAAQRAASAWRLARAAKRTADGAWELLIARREYSVILSRSNGE